MSKPYRVVLTLTSGEVGGKDFKDHLDALEFYNNVKPPYLYKALLADIDGSKVVLKQVVGFPHYKG